MAAERIEILRDCQDGSLSGTYTPAEIRDARDNIPADIDQYSDCRDVLSRALIARTSGGGGSGGGSPSGGGGSGPAGTRRHGRHGHGHHRRRAASAPARRRCRSRRAARRSRRRSPRRPARAATSRCPAADRADRPRRRAASTPARRATPSPAACSSPSSCSPSRPSPRPCRWSAAVSSIAGPLSGARPAPGARSGGRRRPAAGERRSRSPSASRCCSCSPRSSPTAACGSSRRRPSRSASCCRAPPAARPRCCTRARARCRLAGAAALVGFALLAAFTAVSVVWSIAPSDSWLEASRTLSYLSLFAGALALARLAPRRWPALLHGIALACVVVCAWALLTKVFPGALAETERYARLRAPFGYWNAVGLMAALGVPPLLWLGARRSGHAAANALAWPGIALLVVCLMLSYSRGALLALARRAAVLVRGRAAAAARRGRAHGRARRRGAGHRVGVRARPA